MTHSVCERFAMMTAVVMPCLNEQLTLKRSAASLGFGLGDLLDSPDAVLIMVDNASRDGTQLIMSEIQRASPPGAVIVCDEAERGYVPPRAKGIMVAAHVAESRSLHPEELLILQVDADTYYDPGYICAFQEAAGAFSSNVLFEGVTHPPHRFLTGHPGFQRLADDTDAALAPWMADDDSNVIIDDKVSAFSYRNYLFWGGHRREYDSLGREIHAETSRLYLRGKLAGAKYRRVAAASAAPSRRKILRNPIRHFATAGLPRNEAWWRDWSMAYSGPRTLDAFESPNSLSLLKAPIMARKAHLMGMFNLLPTLVQLVSGETPSIPQHPWTHLALDRFDSRPWELAVPAIFEFTTQCIDVLAKLE